jgi:hypothetical protein
MARANGGRVAVRITSAHLDSTAGAGRLWIFASGVRAAQARALVEALDIAPFAVVGADLNTWSEGRQEPAFRALLSAFRDTPEPRRQSTFRIGWQLDALFYRLPQPWSAETRRVDQRFGSDHHPLVGRIGLR